MTDKYPYAREAEGVAMSERGCFNCVRGYKSCAERCPNGCEPGGAIHPGWQPKSPVVQQARTTVFDTVNPGSTPGGTTSSAGQQRKIQEYHVIIVHAPKPGIAVENQDCIAEYLILARDGAEANNDAMRKFRAEFPDCEAITWSANQIQTGEANEYRREDCVHSLPIAGESTWAMWDDSSKIKSSNAIKCAHPGCTNESMRWEMIGGIRQPVCNDCWAEILHNREMKAAEGSSASYGSSTGRAAEQRSPSMVAVKDEAPVRGKGSRVQKQVAGSNPVQESTEAPSVSFNSISGGNPRMHVFKSRQSGKIKELAAKMVQRACDEMTHGFNREMFNDQPVVVPKDNHHNLTGTTDIEPLSIKSIHMDEVGKWTGNFEYGFKGFYIAPNLYEELKHKFNDDPGKLGFKKATLLPEKQPDFGKRPTGTIGCDEDGQCWVNTGSESEPEWEKIIHKGKTLADKVRDTGLFPEEVLVMDETENSGIARDCEQCIAEVTARYRMSASLRELVVSGDKVIDWVAHQASYSLIRQLRAKADELEKRLG